MRELRARLKLSRAAMATMVNLSSQSIEKYEAEIPEDLVKKLKKIAEEKGITDLDWGDGATPKKDIVQTTIRISSDLHHDLRVGAAMQDMSIDSFVQEAIRDRLKGVPISYLKSYELILDNIFKIIEKFDNLRSSVDALRKGVTADVGNSSPNAGEDDIDRSLRELQSAQNKGTDDITEGPRASGDPGLGNRESAGSPKPMGEQLNPPPKRRRGA